MYSKICRGKRNNSSTKNEPVGLSHFAQRRPSSSQLKSSFNNGKESLQFLIYLIGDEAYADMRLYPAFCKVKHRTHFQSSFWNTECTSHHPKSMILGIVVKAGQDRVSGNLQKHSFSPIFGCFSLKGLQDWNKSITFAATNSATPLFNAYQGGTFAFYTLWIIQSNPTWSFGGQNGDKRRQKSVL